jgi:hypothetical protein
MDAWLIDVASWAWDRHHNVLSWYDDAAAHLPASLVGLAVVDAVLLVAAHRLRRREGTRTEVSDRPHAEAR